nr:hypothetical protein CFP56_38963 [Quercus suber]
MTLSYWHSATFFRGKCRLSPANSVMTIPRTTLSYELSLLQPSEVHLAAPFDKWPRPCDDDMSVATQSQRQLLDLVHGQTAQIAIRRGPDPFSTPHATCRPRKRDSTVDPSTVSRSSTSGPGATIPSGCQTLAHLIVAMRSDQQHAVARKKGEQRFTCGLHIRQLLVHTMMVIQAKSALRHDLVQRRDVMLRLLKEKS